MLAGVLAHALLFTNTVAAESKLTLPPPPTFTSNSEAIETPCGLLCPYFDATASMI